MILSLLWKESRENLPKLLLVTAILTIFFIAFFVENQIRSDPYGLRTLLSALFLITCWIFPTWMAASTVTSEKSHRTARLLSSIPVQNWKIFLCKTTLTLLAFLIPTALIFLYLSYTADPLLVPQQWLGMIIGMTSLYFIITATATRLERETSVAAWGLLLTLLAFLSMILVQYLPYISLQWWLFAINPFSPLLASLLINHGHPFTDYSFHFSQIEMSSGLWILGLCLYKVVPNLSRTSHTVDPRANPSNSSTLSNRLFAPRSLSGALIWREFREQIWVLLLAAVSGFLLAIIITALTSYLSSAPAEVKRAFFLRDFANITSSLAFFIPAFVAIILGIGSWATDLDDKVFDFWRSRPISPTAILCTKFLTALTGAFALMAMFGITSTFFSWWASAQMKSISNTDFAHPQALYLPSILAFTTIISFSTLLMILLRKPIFAASATIILFIVSISALTLLTLDPPDSIVQQTQIILFAANILALTLSHLALTHNWQLKPTTH